MDPIHGGGSLAWRLIRAITMAVSLVAMFPVGTSLAEPVIRSGTGLELVIPTAAQGSTDLLARLLADRLSREGMGEIQVRNMPGRSGTLAGAYVAGAIPDGRTLLLATPSSHGIASAFVANMPYDPVRSFTPIVRFAAAPYLLVVKSGGAGSLAAFVDQARNAHSQGREWRYASTGTGGPHHLVAEFYFQRAGLKLNHVPAAGGAAALAKLSDGSVEAMLPAAILALPKIKAGELKALAVTGTQRLKALPDVPTFTELGISVDVESWYGLMAPAGFPPAQAKVLAKTVRDIFSDPAMEAQLTTLATQATVEEGEAFANLVALEVARWTALVTGLGIQSDVKGD